MFTLRIMAVPMGFNVGSLEVRFYGIIMAVSIAVAIFLISRATKYRGLKSDDPLNAAFIAVPLGIIGARLNYVLTSGDSYTFGEMLAIWNGGLSIQGGLIGGFIGILIYCLWTNKNILKFLDITAPALLLAQGIGRWGNFFNQEAFGPRAGFRFFPLTVIIHPENPQVWDPCGIAEPHAHVATFFIESVLNFIGFFIVWQLLKRTSNKHRGIAAAAYLVFYGTVRACIEPFRQDPLMVGGAKWSFILSIVSIVLGVCLGGYVLWRAKTKGDDGSNKPEKQEAGKGDVKNV